MDYKEERVKRREELMARMRIFNLKVRAHNERVDYAERWGYTEAPNFERAQADLEAEKERLEAEMKLLDE